MARELERLLGAPITFLEDPRAPETVTAIRRLPRGAVALLENTRFDPGEEANDPELARSYAALGELYVNDAFGAAHRAHATTEGVAHLLKPAVAGFLMELELRYLGEALGNPRRPFISILGGAKISGKIELIDAMLPKVDRILVGGAMACTFFRAMGLETGTSLVEADLVGLAGELMKRAGDKLLLPDRRRGRADDRRRTRRPARCHGTPFPPAGRCMTSTQASAERFAQEIRGAATVVWNGPMGVFETPPFDQGTLTIARAMAEATAAGAVTIVGGGDSAAAVARAGVADRVTHVSTGGGASLEFLEGRELPGVAALDDI